MARPGYEPEPAAVQTTTTAVTPARRRYGWAALGARVLLTLLGAAGLIISAFMEWINDQTGVRLNVRAFYQESFGNSSTFVATVGFVYIALGLIAIIGLAGSSGWLTRLAGALGIAGFVLFVIQLYRANMTISAVEIGAWVALVGSVVALIAGFFGPRTAVVEPVA